MTEPLTFSQLQLVPPTTPLAVECVTDLGSRYYLATRIPSMRRDVIKITLYGISEPVCTEEKVVEKDRALYSSNGAMRLCVYPITEESRVEKAKRRIATYEEEGE